MQLSYLVAAIMLNTGSITNATSSQHWPHNSEVAHVRTYFYVGGEYVDDGRGGHHFRGQMYVEKLVPVQGVTQKWPVVLMHGNSMTGTVSIPSHTHDLTDRKSTVTDTRHRTSSTSPMAVVAGPPTSSTKATRSTSRTSRYAVVQRGIPATGSSPHPHIPPS
jgi:hypothetical protein